MRTVNTKAKDVVETKRKQQKGEEEEDKRVKTEEAYSAKGPNRTGDGAVPGGKNAMRDEPAGNTKRAE